MNREPSESDPTIDVTRADTLTANDSPAAAPQPLPASIGGYRILGKLGEGGMGIVLEAEQENPKRRVALKVIRGGTFVDESHVRMFRREAETLALLKHPNIGAIYEAGRTEAGEHFFAMELVRGRTLDQYLQERPQTLDRDEIRFRLRLFLSICAAVNYAHQRGVIHRDLKPSNLIVGDPPAGAAPEGDAVPEIKVLDFGLARITASDVEAATAISEVGVIKGTLPYMSPEQARGDSAIIDLRSDVYSLGVILYQMLTGKRPYDIQRTSIVESVRIICEQPPAPLSQVWTGARAPDADLQVILGKALEKEADRRYGSAAALADDVQRHLDSRPILARAPSTLYQLRKFAKRNRALVAGVAATLVALVAGIIATTTFGVREAAQRRAADRARLDTQAVVEFQTNMLGAIDPQQVGLRLESDLAARLAASLEAEGRPQAQVAAAVSAFRNHMSNINTTDAALRVIDQNILEQAVATSAEQFATRPRIHAQLLGTISETYRKLGLFDRAEPPILAACALLDSVEGPGSAPALKARRQLASLYSAVGRNDEAETLFMRVVAGQRGVLSTSDEERFLTMNDLAVMYIDQERFEKADSILALALLEHTRLHGEEHAYTLNLLGNRAWGLTRAERFAEAESLGVRVLALRRRVLGQEHLETMTAINNLAVVYMQTGRPDLAEPLYLEDYAFSRRKLGDEHPEVLVTMTNLGRMYNRQQKWSEAEAILSRALASTRRVMSPDFIGVGITSLALGEALIGLGRLREAEPHLIEAHRILLAVTGSDSDPGVQRAISELIRVYDGTNRATEAAKWRKRLNPPA